MGTVQQTLQRFCDINSLSSNVSESLAAEMSPDEELQSPIELHRSDISIQQTSDEDLSVAGVSHSESKLALQPDADKERKIEPKPDGKTETADKSYSVLHSEIEQTLETVAESRSSQPIAIPKQSHTSPVASGDNGEWPLLGESSLPRYVMPSYLSFYSLQI